MKARSDQENNTVMQRIKIRMLTKVTCPDKQFLLIAFPFKDPMNPIFHYTIDMKKGFSPFQNKEISETCSKDEKEKPSKISPTKPKKKKKIPSKNRV